MPVLPPIQLRDYYVEHLNYDVLTKPDSDDLSAERGAFVDMGIDVTYEDAAESEAEEVSSHEERDEQPEQTFKTFRVTVHLNRNAKSPKRLHYRASVRLAGLFEIQPRTMLDPVPDGDEYLTHCLASVVSTLYGPAREVLASLTASSPFGKVLLPSVAPYAVAQQMLEARRATEGGAPEPNPSDGD